MKHVNLWKKGAAVHSLVRFALTLFLIPSTRAVRMRILVGPSRDHARSHGHSPAIAANGDDATA